MSNINRFSKVFHYQNRETVCSNIITEDPTTSNMCCYTTLWNVRYRTQANDDAWSTLIKLDLWPPNSPDLNPVDYAVWGWGPQQMVYQRRQFTTINQVRQAINHWVGRTVAAFGWSQVAPLVSGVAGLSASSSSKADTLNIWCGSCEKWQLICTITKTLNRLCPVVDFLQCVVTDIVSFSIITLKTMIFH